MSKKKKDWQKEATKAGVKFNKSATIDELKKAIELASLGNTDTPEIKEETEAAPDLAKAANVSEEPEYQATRQEIEGKDMYYQGHMPNMAMVRKQKKHIESTEYRSVIFIEQTPNIIHMFKSYEVDLAKK